MLALKYRAFMPLLCAVALFCMGCDSPPPDKRVSQARSNVEIALAKLNGETMGTYWAVTIADPVVNSKYVQQEIEEVLADVNQDMSTYIPDSAISRFNRHHDREPQKISTAFMRNIVAAQKISMASNGVYDITVGPLVNLWGFGPDKIKKAPTQTQIDAALTKVGYQQLLVDEAAGTIAKINSDLMLDLSSIAKGYGVDAVAERLNKLGYNNYLVDIGGELLARGNKAGEAWRVAIEQPVNDRHVQQIIALNQGENMQTAMATSGNYRNFIDYDGKHAVHTIDPRTGRSSQSRLLSVTVVADSCMYADGYATAMMALGSDAAGEFARTQHLAALFIYADPDDAGHFIVNHSPEWQKRFGE